MLTRKDLLGLGFSAREIKHRLARGRLHPVMRGVYAVGRPDLTQEGRWMAAVLACGEGAVLSHASAASLWGVARTGRSRPRPTPVHVSLPRRSSLGRQGIRAHARPGLRPEDLTSHRGIPVTSPVRTLLDLATHEPPTASSAPSTRPTSTT